MSKIIKITIFAETRKKLGNKTIQRKHHWDVCVPARHCAPKIKASETQRTKEESRSAMSSQTLVCFILFIESDQYFSTVKT